MEKALQSYGVPLEALKELKHELAGDLPQIWADRPWHPLTRTEIYALILVTNELGFPLPRLIVERIAFWIQLIELCKDLRTKALSLHIVVENWLYTAIEMSKYCPKLYWESTHFAIENKQYVIVKNNEREWYQWGRERRDWVYGRPNRLPDEIKTLERYLARKDRYRIVLPNRRELDEFLKNKCTTS